jgi:predicted RNA binding protein YcfA (HicA-like mRNA interferase family)
VEGCAQPRASQNEWIGRDFDKSNQVLAAYNGQSACRRLDLQMYWRRVMPVLDIATLMCINTHMDSREVIRRLKADGWYQIAQRGSHVQFKHPEKGGRVTVPHPRKSLPLKTLASIEKQAKLVLR